MSFLLHPWSLVALFIVTCVVAIQTSPNSPRCTIRADSGDVIVVRPQGQGSVAHGAVVQYACREGYVLTGGQLVLACGPDGAFIGTPPVCQDPETIIQDSNNVDLTQRPETTNHQYAYTSLGSHLTIFRTGVIKQWKFYSPHRGFSFFQVWRPNPAGGNFSFVLVGQSQVLTAGQGEETYDLPEADWIPVQPGDRIGLYEMGEFRGFVPYTYCNKDTSPADFGVMWSIDINHYGDFSTSQAQSFNSNISCRTFSFKAVIHPVTSVPAQPDMHTSDVALVSRPRVGSRVIVYLGDSSNFYIPADGYVTEWQFYVKHGGSGIFQVWRRREDKGEREYQLIGENKINVTTIVNQGQRLYTLKVPEGERILAKAGDIISFVYGKDRLGISYSFCNRDSYPESNNIHWLAPLTPDSTIIGNIYSFGYTGGSYLCRVFSFRAIVEQAEIRTSNVALVSRPIVGLKVHAYLGNSSNFYIPADGYVTEWEFYVKYGGSGAFQVWRRREDKGERKFELIGQNKINIVSDEARPYLIYVPGRERITVKAGDIIGFLYGEDKLGIPYSLCSGEESTQSNNIYWYDNLTPETAVVGQVYGFSSSGGRYVCRVFSLRAVIQQTRE